MTSKREINLENESALVPLHGGADKRPRPLDQDVTTIGRAKGCDIGLEAPEISALHCLLYRTAEGFRLRDCGSRTGTRVNGEPPRHSVLAAGDVLQIGPFSFAVNVPPSVRGEREEHATTKVRWDAEQAATSALLEKQRTSLNQAEAALREQRAELARMMTDLRELQNAIQKQQGADAQALAQENEELRRLLAEYESRQTQSADKISDGTMSAAQAACENELLHQLLAEKENAIGELNHQVEELKRQPQAQSGPRAANIDLDSYEAELNRERQKLESDRAELNKEIEQLRVRNTELDEATREMEMAMSKERAEFARERIRLDRLREEVRNEVERVQRDAGMRESLASVNKLRDELTQKKGKEDRVRPQSV